ncbi:hypothetical protein PENTCL1PPCAC_9265, partial [Pristionchus entomophagus]
KSSLGNVPTSIATGIRIVEMPEISPSAAKIVRIPNRLIASETGMLAQRAVRATIEVRKDFSKEVSTVEFVKYSR